MPATDLGVAQAGAYTEFSEERLVAAQVGAYTEFTEERLVSCFAGAYIEISDPLPEQDKFGPRIQVI